MIDTSIIKQFEGCKLSAYLCPAKVWTIGYGSTTHPDGRPVKRGDVITLQQAEEYLQLEVQKRLKQMALPYQLTDNMRAALVSFQFNVGQGAWMRSTVRRRMLANSNDPAIRQAFMMWNKAGGKVLPGLTRRRQAEADLYFK